MTKSCDILIIGAGAAGMPAAIFAADAGARVLVVDVADRIGGSFHLSSGMMSAAGTRLQAAKGIHDTPQMHYDDVMRISHGTANPDILRLAVEHAADTLHWLLDLGFAALPEHPVISFGHEPYLVPRTYWGEDGGRSVLSVLAPPYQAGERAGGIETWLETSLVRLTVAGGAVTGAVVRRDGEEIAVTAGAVLLATGGYTANPELFSSLSFGKRLWGGGYPHGQGQGLLAAVAAGGQIINQDTVLPGFAGVEDPEANGGYTAATLTAPQERMPWEIYVDAVGRRFMREDDPSVDQRERALLAQPDMSFWAVWDAGVAREAPPFFDLPNDIVAARFATLPSYRQANTLAELAILIGVDPAVLADTVASYNAGVADGTRDPLGREYRPRPIAEAPFYAVKHVGWSITSFAGVKIDAELRVVDAAGIPIPNLYAAGEIIGFGATSGNAFAGGMSVTPAMTFGRLLGTRLGQAATATAAA